MQWEQFSAIALTILYYLLLWLLIAVPAALVLFAISRFFPTHPREAAGEIISHRPTPSDATNRFKAGIEAAKERLSFGTIRVLLDRKHVKLREELVRIRKEIEQRLQQITRASTASRGTSLVELLQGFKADTDRALDYSLLDDSLPDRSKERSKARAAFWFLATFMLVFITVNFGLLYLFFDEFFAGQTIPYIGVQLAAVTALIFPLFEAAGGVGTELTIEKSDSPTTKFVITTALMFVIFALASLEFFIFYNLFANGFTLTRDFARGGFVHYAVAAVGPALTLIEAIFGFGLARNFMRLREIGAIHSIKDQIFLQRRFVDGLEARYGAIEQASSDACSSVDDFVGKIKGRGEADLPVVSALADQRKQFVDAINQVNPLKWPGDIAPSKGDVDAVTTYAWALPLGVLLILAVFTATLRSALLDTGLIGSPELAFALALLVPLVSLIAGGFIFDRTASATTFDDGWKDVFSPRNGAFKALGVVVLFTVASGVAWICIQANGLTGVAEALVLVGFLFAMSWVGSYADLALRGLGYWASVIWHAVLWVLRSAIRLAHLTWLFGAAALSAAALLILQILAFPFTLVRGLFKPARGRELQPA